MWFLLRYLAGGLYTVNQNERAEVSIITSTVERQAAIEFAKAAAMRPHIVGEA